MTMHKIMIKICWQGATLFRLLQSTH